MTTSSMATRIGTRMCDPDMVSDLKWWCISDHPTVEELMILASDMLRQDNRDAAVAQEVAAAASMAMKEYEMQHIGLT